MSSSPTKFRRCSSVALGSNAPNHQPLRSSIGRRWSFDSTREGYVKDLRKYQGGNYSRDESYPLMLSEKQGSSSSSSKKKTSTTSCIVSSPSSSSNSSPNNSRKKLYGRGHSMDVSSFAVPEDFELTQSSYSVFSTLAVAGAESPSVARSIEDHRPLLSSLRQRSSSLPRILPPIFDDETDKVGHLGTHRKSIAGSLLSSSPTSTMGMATNSHGNSSTLVREMQKFVCRQASDVSHLLPLPLPTKYSLIIKEEDDEENSNVVCGDDSLSSEQAASALLHLAKVHAASLTMKRVAPQLFHDVLKTLNNDSPFHLCGNTPTTSSSSAASNASLHTSPNDRALDIQNRIADSPFCGETIRSQALALISSSSPRGLCLNEDLVVSAINFRYSLEGNPPQIVSCKFDRISSCTEGPILLDLYSFIFNCIELSSLDEGALRDLLTHYHSSLSFYVSLLKAPSPHGILEDPQEFLRAVREHLRPGLFIAFLLSTKRSGIQDKSDAKAKMEALIEDLKDI